VQSSFGGAGRLYRSTERLRLRLQSGWLLWGRRGEYPTGHAVDGEFVRSHALIFYSQLDRDPNASDPIFEMTSVGLNGGFIGLSMMGF
jgi:hypothetical protein